MTTTRSSELGTIRGLSFDAGASTPTYTLAETKTRQLTSHYVGTLR